MKYHNFEVLPTSGKEYENHQGGSPIINYDQVREFSQKLPRWTFFYIIAGATSKELRKLFGTSPKRWMGSLRHDIWKIQIAENAFMFLLCSSEGCRLELTGSGANDLTQKIPNLIQFLVHLFLDLKKEKGEVFNDEEEKALTTVIQSVKSNIT